MVNKILLRFDLVTYFLTQSHPWSHMIKNIQSNSEEDGAKNVGPTV